LFGFKKSDGYWTWFAGNVASGGAAGASSLLFVYSLDFARTRLANDAKSAKGGGDRQFNGLVDVYRKTLKSDGLAGLYRGFVPSVVGIIVYRGLYFGVYDSLSEHALKKYHSRRALTRLAEPVVLVGPLEGSFLASFGLGWGVTIGAGLASYPLDTIRRRMMMTSGGTVHYKSMFDAGSQIVAKEGTKSLFKGAGANILRGVAGAGVLSLYDKLQQVMFGKVYSGGGCLFYQLTSFKKLTCVNRIWLNTLISSARWFYGVSRSLIDLVSHPLSYFRISGDILLVLTLDTNTSPPQKALHRSRPR